MLKEEILNLSKGNKIYVSFDMDGVVAEYDVAKTDEHKQRVTNYYLNKRPINTVINFMKELNETENVTVGILSCCHFVEQKSDKISWLKKNVPFLRIENIHIICYENIDYDKENKYSLKTQYLENLFKNSQYIVYHIDDDVRVIGSMKKSNLINVKHISSIIE